MTDQAAQWYVDGCPDEDCAERLPGPCGHFHAAMIQASGSAMLCMEALDSSEDWTTRTLDQHRDAIDAAMRHAREVVSAIRAARDRLPKGRT